MTRESQEKMAIEPAVRAIHLIEALQGAIDKNCRRLLSMARTDWEHLFGVGKEPSDTCVSVRIHSAASKAKKAAQPGSAFLAKSNVASPPNGKPRERFA
jgi:hypothetical protein